MDGQQSPGQLGTCPLIQLRMVLLSASRALYQTQLMRRWPAAVSPLAPGMGYARIWKSGAYRW